MVQELGGPLLAGYSPAEQVGAGVRPRIRALLLASPDFRKILERTQAQGEGAELPRTGDRQYALEVLARLRQGLDDVEREVLGIGHNNPPEPLSLEGDRRGAFNDVRVNIAALESELAKPAPDEAAVAANSEGLVRFGVKMTAWLSQRTTKFVDAALAALALKVSGLLPVLIDALSAVAHAVGH